MTGTATAHVPHGPNTSECVAQNFWDFKSAVAESFVPLEVSSDRPEPFSGKIRTTGTDQVQVCEIAASTHLVQRTPELIARSDRHYYKLSLQLTGHGLLIQDNREALLEPGDIAIYDTHRPYSLCFDDEFRALVLMFPQHLVDLPVEMVGQLTAARMSADDPLVGMLAPFLTRMAPSLERLPSSTGSRLTYSAVDLLTTVLASQLDLDRAGGNPHLSLMHEIQQFIDENLASPDLSPAQIADAHYISTRHLHSIFHDQDITVSSWIRSRRLERCRRDLLDPLYRADPVSVIAARWGFVNAAHFSRVFKATYDRSPSDLRATTR